jgi:hypothetical protein
LFQVLRRPANILSNGDRNRVARAVFNRLIAHRRNAGKQNHYSRPIFPNHCLTLNRLESLQSLDPESNPSISALIARQRFKMTIGFQSALVKVDAFIKFWSHF